MPGPGWLVEGIADYVRFFKYEPDKLGQIAKDPHFDSSYRTSAAFLNFVTEKYDKDLVKKVNRSLRVGEYRETIWKALTKKSLKELDEEWRASLKKGAANKPNAPQEDERRRAVTSRLYLCPIPMEMADSSSRHTTSGERA